MVTKMLRLVLVLAAAALCHAAVHHNFRGLSILTPGEEAERKDEIPQRCIDNSVTPVSCANVNQEDGLMPHPDDCQLFYYCVNGLQDPICRACPAGLHFSSTKHVCDVPEHAGCNSAA